MLPSYAPIISRRTWGRCAILVSEMAIARTKLATAADLVVLPDHVMAEIIHGVIVEKASPSAEHGVSQLSFGATLKRRFQRINFHLIILP